MFPRTFEKGDKVKVILWRKDDTEVRIEIAVDEDDFN